MEIQNNVRKIVENGNVDEMYKLTDILEDAICDLEDYDTKCAEMYKMKLYIMANGKVLNKEMAEEIVHCMQPSGMRWSYEEAKGIMNDFGINDIRPADFFVVMNSAYNDYHNLFGENIENYVKFTTNFINDEDAKEGKVFIYFTSIPK